MARTSKRSTMYTAPDGYVYDFKEPKDDKHLYAKYLAIGRFDSIDNYILIPDPKGAESND